MPYKEQMFLKRGMKNVDFEGLKIIIAQRSN